MRDRDFELIAQLAEGSLEDETEARALVASSEEHRLEYEAQLTAIEALSSVEPVMMTDTERAAIHRDLWTEMTAQARPDIRTPWYYRFVPVAASLFVVVGIGAVIVQDDGGATDGDAPAIAAEQAATTTAADAGDDGGDLFGDAEGGESALSPFASEEVYSRLADDVRSGTVATSNQERDADFEACLGQIDLDGYELIGPVPAPPEIPADVDLDLIAAALNGDPETGPIAFIDADTCEILYLDE